MFLEWIEFIQILHLLQALVPFCYHLTILDTVSFRLIEKTAAIEKNAENSLTIGTITKSYQNGFWLEEYYIFNQMYT